MKELLKKLRKYEIKIRKAITAQMQGDFHSVFKGSGLEFDDVRSYQYGDDVRTIDWKVSAKGHGTFVKKYREEKEQTVFFILDVSASQEIGSASMRKVDVGKEICSILAFSAIREGSQVGVLCYSDKKEKYIKPAKGTVHAYEIFSSLFKLKPVSKKTNINQMILYTLEMIKRRSIIVIISDFIDEDYLRNLTALAKRHDLVVIHVSDKRETDLPQLGIIPLLDKETGKTVWVNTSSEWFKNNVKNNFNNNKNELEKFCQKHQANYLQVLTNEDYVPKLIKLFRYRNKSRKSTLAK